MKGLYDKSSTELEIKYRKIVDKALRSVVKRLEQRAEKKRITIDERLKNAHEYKSLDEAKDMWGYGYLTDEQFEEVKEVFENDEKDFSEKTLPEEAAVRFISEIVYGNQVAIRTFESDLKEEKQRKEK